MIVLSDSHLARVVAHVRSVLMYGELRSEAMAVSLSGVCEVRGL